MNNEAILSQQPTANSQQPTANSHNNALVSIIIPAYNTAPYIHRAIESSLRQTHKNIEVIVVNDGSTDETLKVAQEYAGRDERVRVFTQENAGVSAARNYGIREAHGEYIMFQDSDDWFEDDAAAVFLDAQMKYPDKLIASVAYMVNFDAEHNVFCRTLSNKYPVSRIFSSAEETLTALFSSGVPLRFFTVPPKIFRADIIHKHNLQFPEGIHYGEDQIFTIAYMLQMNGTVLLNAPLVDVLYRSESAEHVTYNERRIFVDGEIVDFAQMMIDMANTPELKTLLKYNHARLMRFELDTAFMRGASLDRINKVREKMRIYWHEYITSKYVPFSRKAVFLVKAYLPIPLVKFARMCNRFVHATISIVKFSDKAETIKGEIIPYW